MRRFWPVGKQILGGGFVALVLSGAIGTHAVWHSARRSAQRDLVNHSIDWASGASAFGSPVFEEYCWRMHIGTLELAKGGYLHPLMADMKIAGVYVQIALIHDKDGDVDLRDAALRDCLTVTERINDTLENHAPGFVTRARLGVHLEYDRRYWGRIRTQQDALEWAREYRRWKAQHGNG